MEYVLAALALIALTALVIALVGILVALVEFLTGNPYHNRVFDGFLGGRILKKRPSAAQDYKTK